MEFPDCKCAAVFITNVAAIEPRVFMYNLPNGDEPINIAATVRSMTLYRRFFELTCDAPRRSDQKQQEAREPCDPFEMPFDHQVLSPGPHTNRACYYANFRMNQKRNPFRNQFSHRSPERAWKQSPRILELSKGDRKHPSDWQSSYHFHGQSQCY